MTGWLLLIGQIIVLILNFFLPLSFWFDDTGYYHTSIARTVFLAIQVFIFYTVTIYMAFIARKTDKALRRRHKTIGFFSFVMASFIFLQIFFPFTPFYAAGDQYIKTAAAIISEQFKHSPVYRIGGDEFVAILRDKDYKNHIEILKSFNAKMEENVKTGDIVISCGFSEFIPHQDKSLLRIFERADKHMYERKKLLKELKHQDTSSIKQ